MIWVQFIGAALLTVLAATKLAEYGDTIGLRTGLVRMFIGTLLLAGATSLPELLTTINSISQNVPDLAVGNIFGSCMFNMFMLGVLDLLYQKARILRKVMINHALSAGMAILLTGLAVFLIMVNLKGQVGWLGMDSLLLMAVYIGGMRLVQNNSLSNTIMGGEMPKEADIDLANVPSLRRGLIGFGLASLALVVITPTLVSSSTQIAVLLGVSTGFVGAALVAVVTSLPEVVTTIAAVRIGAYDMAVGNLFGSNMFNIFALAVTDLFFTQGRFLAHVDPVMTLAGIMALILTTMGLIGNVARMEKRILFVELDALVIMVSYGLFMWMLYARGIVG